MRFVIDGLPLTEPKTGIGHYTFELTTALARIAPQDTFDVISPLAFGDGAIKDTNRPIPPNVSFKVVPANMVQRRWFSIGLPGYIRRNKVGIFHGTNYEVPFRRVCPSVVTVHDLSLFLFPQLHLSRRVWRAKVRLPLMVRSADIVITPTRQIMREVCERFDIAQDRVLPIPEAPRAIFTPATRDHIEEVCSRLRIASQFILAVGTIEPRKNLITLIRAFVSLIKTTELRPQLVITGKKGWLHRQFFAEIERAGISDLIRLTGYVSDSDLQALYSSCCAFVYPSLYEGFGLPPLEAMACRAPVIASRIGSLTEVLGDAAFFIDASNASELEQALVNMIRDANVRAAFRHKGAEWVSQYHWEKTAQLTREAYGEAVSRYRAREASSEG